MSKKVSAADFAAFLKKRLAAKDGYIMGATGQDPKTWAKNSWWFTQYSGEKKQKALYWRENAPRVWDCAGLAEGYYKEMTGTDVNTRARYIYSGWCSLKGEGKIPAKHRVPGAAVFIYSASAGEISHIGYLVEPVDAADPAGDWFVIEARGVMYGVVQTKLSARGWNRWGLMDKYFDYSAQAAGTENAGDSASFVKIAPGSWNMRVGPGVAYQSVGIVRGGEKLEKVQANGWIPVLYRGEVCWIGPKGVC